MSKRQRERYTERTRPHRKKAGPGAVGGGQSDGFDNPIVLVAVGGLLLAIVLALGVYFGRSAIGGFGADQPSSADTSEEATAPSEVQLFVPGDGSHYAQPDDMGLQPGERAYFSTISTDKGDIVVELWPEVAPAHANAFAFLASEGFYDGLVFHRVEDWVVQGGDPTGTGGGGPGYGIPAEFNEGDPAPHSYGTLAMARSGDPDSGGSQFYFIKAPEGASQLDGSYTVFGHVVSGMDVVEQLAIGDAMSSVTFEDKDFSERAVGPDDIRAGNLPEAPGGGTE